MSDRFAELGIKYKNQEQYKTTCPNCYKLGKQHINDTCLSVNTVDMVFKCHKCDWTGSLQEKNMNYTPPDQSKLTQIGNKAIDFLINRGHTREIIEKYKITMTTNGVGVVFPYFRDGDLVNWKVRLIAEKKFFQSPNALQIVYNYDNVMGSKEIIITESEEDCMMVDQAGFPNVVSVSQGAPNVNDKDASKKLECFNNSTRLFNDVEKIIIAVDNDVNGDRLAHEIKRRYGAEICVQVKFPDDCKDTRDVRLKYGIEKVKELILNAKPVKIDGVFDIEDVASELLHQYDYGLAKGTTTYWKQIDALWTWRGGELNLWTGYNNEGKSTFLSQISLIKALKESWKIAFFSPEDMPPVNFYRNLIEMHVGGSMDISHYNRMQREELLNSIEEIKDRMIVIDPPDDYNLDTIINKAKYLVKTQGIKALILDPYNVIEHLMRPGEREDLYISRFMKELKKFAIKYDVSVNLVAHQLTPRKDPKSLNYPTPNKYNIKGGGTFADKADNVLIVWRPSYGVDRLCPDVAFISDKIRNQKLVGRPGQVDFVYDWKQSRYFINGYNPLMGDLTEPPLFIPDKHIEPSINFDKENEEIVPF